MTKDQVMTTAIPLPRAPVRRFAGRLVLASLLACAGGTVSAATIGEVAAPALETLTPVDPFAVPGLDAVAPAAREPRATSDEIDSILRTLEMPRPVLEDESHWFEKPAPQPLALQPETLMRDAGGDVWLNADETANEVANGPGLSDLLRNIVNVRSEVYTAPGADSAPAAPVSTRGRGLGLGTGGNLLRELVVDAIEPYRRADGRIGFSVFGFGDFFAEVGGDRRSLRVTEEGSGWTLNYRRPVRAAPAASANPAAVRAVSLPDGVPAARPIDVSDIHVLESLRGAMRWLQESLLVKVVVVLWVLALIARGLVGLGRAVRQQRRRNRGDARRPAPAVAMAGAAPAPPRVGGPAHQHMPRKRHSRSPSLRNLLRSLGFR